MSPEYHEFQSVRKKSLTGHGDHNMESIYIITILPICSKIDFKCFHLHSDNVGYLDFIMIGYLYMSAVGILYSLISGF